MFEYKKVGHFVLLNKVIMTYFPDKKTANARKMEMVSLGYKRVEIIKAYAKERDNVRV